MLGGFKCGEIKWELLKTGKGNTWGGRLLEMIMNSMIMHWDKDKMRCRGENEPSRLDLVITQGADLNGYILVTYMNPFRESEMEIKAMSDVERAKEVNWEVWKRRMKCNRDMISF